jgi:hypothetical protein
LVIIAGETGENKRFRGQFFTCFSPFLPVFHPFLKNANTIPIWFALGLGDRQPHAGARSRTAAAAVPVPRPALLTLCIPNQLPV